MSTLYVLLEGPDDKRFFNRVLSEKFMMRYDKIQFVYYSGMTPEWVSDEIRKYMTTQKDFIMLADYDSEASCITERKDAINSKLAFKSPPGNMAIVRKSIESWCMAGLTHDASRELQITYYPNTQDIGKQDLENFQRGRPWADFMTQILDKFDFETAILHNESFRHFVKAFLPHLIRT